MRTRNGRHTCPRDFFTRRVQNVGDRPFMNARWTSSGVSKAIPVCRCSALYHAKKRRLYARACSDICEGTRESWAILERFVVRFDERIIVGHVRPRTNLYSEELRQRLRCHGCAGVAVDGPLGSTHSFSIVSVNSSFASAALSRDSSRQPTTYRL